MVLHIRTVLDKHFEDVVFDVNLCKRINHYTTRYLNKNENHIAFFGGVLMGVYPVKFLDADREIWYVDTFGIDDDLLREDFLKADYIDKTHIVASDPYNYIPGYVSMRLRSVTNIPLNVKKETMHNLFVMLHCKYMGSLMSRRFKYLADKSVMEATFAGLNYKFDIKFIGSWGKLFVDRADSIVRSGSIYDRYLNDNLKKGDDQDYWAKRIVTDTQSRLRELVNKYYSAYINTINAGNKFIVSSDTAINSDGERILKDKVNGYNTYLRYTKSLMSDKGSLIRPELVEVIESILKTMPGPPLLKTLEYLTNNYNHDFERLDPFIDSCIIYTFNYLQSIKSSVQRTADLKDTLTKVRSKLMAPKNTEREVMHIRDIGEKIVKDATGIKNPAVISSVRTGVCLYLVLRTMTKNYYSR